MRPRPEYEKVKALLAARVNDCAIARATGIPRCTVREWRTLGPPGRAASRARCPRCDGVELDAAAYAYLLGLYLGDGCLSLHPRRVFRLRITLDEKYPGIIAECARAMEIVSSGRAIGRVQNEGCIEVGAYWKHWPCLFPQHGPGKKHARAIALVHWQSQLAMAHSGALLRGFIHSDGCRFGNIVNGRAYPRYEFSNRSADILRIFCAACDAYGVRWTQPSTIHISVARAPDVAKLDLAVGPKR